jgi:hypothetical protein
MNVYLSGGMEYASDEGRGWREEMEQWLRRELDWSSFNPNRESEKFLLLHAPGTDFRDLKSGEPGRFRTLVRRIVELDCRAVAEQSDLVVCYWDESAQRGAGTKGEITIARYFNKPVYLVTSVPETEIPGWVLGCVTRIFPDFDALRNFLKP